jgi:hypothetical protein
METSGDGSGTMKPLMRREYATREVYRNFSSVLGFWTAKMRRRTVAAGIAAMSAIVLCLRALPGAQPAGPQAATPDDFSQPFRASPDHRAIQYTARSAADRISLLNRRLNNGQTRLRFEPVSGYLRSLLEALEVPVESQLAVFSRTSLQGSRIGPDNPRVVFFNDDVMIAWPRGGFIEAAAIDPEQGPVFYTLQQRESGFPGLVRNDSCLECHRTAVTLGVPGLALASVVPDAEGFVSIAPFITDHRSPFAERFGGWYVTGSRVPMAHMGNLVASDPAHPALNVTKESIELHSLSARFDTRGYLSPHSDIVAHMVLDHQVRMINLMTRIGWEVRVALSRDPAGDAQLRSSLGGWAREFVDYMLFIDEAPPNGSIRGASGFAEKFASQGPRDRQGRSLRDLDLERRLLKYPCTYLIYSEQFDQLPALARAAIYQRMGEVLSGTEHAPKYARLSASDRRAIVEILRDTKKGLGF